jgi:hypothetical protein
MSAAKERVIAVDERLPFWLKDLFLDRLNRIEDRHQRIQTQHESLRRNLEAVQRTSSADLQEAWSRYCEVIEELDRTTAELEVLRTRSP